MAEVKITCPNCFKGDQCFEETAMDFKSYMCFNCGFTSNSAYTKGSDALKKAEDSSTELMREISLFDYDRKIKWVPSVLNMGKFGVIYPEGTKNNWVWKWAQITKLTEDEKKDPKYQGHDNKLDIENAKEYGQHEFLQACKDMGIIKEL